MHVSPDSVARDTGGVSGVNDATHVDVAPSYEDGAEGVDEDGGEELEENEGDADGEDDEIVITGDFKMRSDFKYEVLSEPRIQKPRREPLEEAVAEAVERQKATNTRTDLPPFGHRVYDTFAQLEAAWKSYMKAHFVHYRRRTSQSIEAYNEKHPSQKLPPNLLYTMVTWRCTHGVIQKSRQKKDKNGKKAAKSRTPRVIRFTDCLARFAVCLVLIDGRWAFHSVSEVNRHNHKCSKRIWESYQSAAVLLEEHDLFNEVVAMIQAQALTVTTLDAISTLTTVSISAQQLANFKRDRMGGRSALANLRLLIMRFSAFEGYRCLVIQDQHKQVCGIVVQSAAQRHMFEQYGDNFLLDWTHNTNNVGYYLGSLMVTSVSGSDVSVLDFLCMTQSKDMMRAIFSFFIEHNPSALTNLCSVIIDKDYIEWAILLEMFPGVAVLLCQFHAVKWFAQVVCDVKYAIPVQLQDHVYAILHDMVYVKTKEDFESRRWLLEMILHEVSPSFLAYMQERWYSCLRMWSDFARGKFFTAINPTTNRVESGWSQTKGILGMKLRVDMCFQAVFTYATAVLRREIKWVAEYDSPMSVLRADADPFIRPVLAELSDYCAAYVQAQHEAHFRMQLTHVVVKPDADSVCVSVERLDRSGEPREVNTQLWTCECATHMTSRLPCRHIIFVSRLHLHHHRLPLDVIPRRWKLAAALPALSKMEKWAEQLQSLRVSLLGPSARVIESRVTSAREDPADDDEDYDLSTIGRDSAHASVAHVILKRREIATGVVVDNIEKRNLADAAFEPLRAFLMVQSSQRFKAMATQMRDVFSTLLASWEACTLAGDEGEQAPTVSGGVDADADARIASMVSAAVPTMSRTRLHHPATPPDQRTLSSAQAFVPHLQPATCDLNELLLSPVTAPETHDSNGSEHDSISTLGLSHASSVINAVAVQDAVSSWRATVSNQRGLPVSAGVDRVGAVRSSTHRAAPGSDAAAKRSAAAANLDEGVLSIMTLAMRPHANTTKKQRARAVTASRVATVEQRSQCPVLLEDFVCAVRKGEGVSLAEQTLRKYPLLMDEEWLLKREVVTARTSVRVSDFNVNFTIPKTLLYRLQASDDKARAAFWNAGGSVIDLATEARSGEFVSKLQGAYAVRGFTGRNLTAFADYYDALRLCAAYEFDVAWLMRAPAAGDDDVYPYPAYSAMGIPLTSSFLAEAVIKVLGACSLDTSFEIIVDGTNSASIRLAEIASSNERVVVCDSLHPHLVDGQIPFAIPDTPLEDVDAIVFPVYLSKSHWGLVVACFNDTQHVVMLYDPLVNEANQDLLRDHWAQYCRPFVAAWMSRDHLEDTTTTASEFLLECPRQHRDDATNCGNYCIAMCTDLVARTSDFECLETLSPAVISELRLRTLWGVTCRARKVDCVRQKETITALNDFASFSREIEKTATANGGAKAKAARRLGK